jgi:hypothetical protein
MRHLIFTLFLLTSVYGGFDIPIWSVDGGVTKSQSSTFTLSATIAQPEAGTIMQIGNYKLRGGFWSPSVEDDVCMVPIIMYLLD